MRGTVVVTGGGDSAGGTLPLSDQDLRLMETVVDRISGVGQKRGGTVRPFRANVCTIRA